VLDRTADPVAGFRNELFCKRAAGQNERSNGHFVMAGLQGGSSHGMIRAASTAPRRILATSLQRHTLKHLYTPLTRQTYPHFVSTAPLRNHTFPIYLPRIATYTTMSSATSFYDFKPADSTSSSCSLPTCLPIFFLRC
jgi:hypothetical protein